jgi:FAD/FMN-containing dehydrogenase
VDPASAATLTGDVVNRCNPRYGGARLDFNRRVPPSAPRYVVFCESVRDAQDAVRLARAHRLPIRARSGRLSYEGYSLVDDGVVIDVSRLNGVVLDKARGTAEVGAGANLGQVYAGLWDQGALTIPGGGCVGVAGLTLGGGFGLLARLLGPTCDALGELEMVDARGEVVRANASVHPERFWASCGGGGGNFGVATRFTFRVIPIGDVTALQITWAWEDLRAVFEAWQAWADPDRLDIRVTPILTLPARTAGYLSVLGEFVGPLAELDHLIQPLLRAAKPTGLKIVEEPYIDAVHRFVGDPPGSAEWAVEPATLRTPPVPALHRFKNTSAFVFRRPRRGSEMCAVRGGARRRAPGFRRGGHPGARGASVGDVADPPCPAFRPRPDRRGAGGSRARETGRHRVSVRALLRRFARFRAQGPTPPGAADPRPASDRLHGRAHAERVWSVAVWAQSPARCYTCSASWCGCGPSSCTRSPTCRRYPDWWSRRGGPSPARRGASTALVGAAVLAGGLAGVLVLGSAVRWMPGVEDVGEFLLVAAVIAGLATGSVKPWRVEVVGLARGSNASPDGRATRTDTSRLQRGPVRTGSKACGPCRSAQARGR